MAEAKRLKFEDNDEVLLQRALQELDERQQELDKINDEASDKVLEVEQHYNGLRRPVYVGRNSIAKKIPDFWKKAITSHRDLRDKIALEDEEILRYLTEVDVEDFEDIKSGYKITFRFTSNPYFEDAELTRELHFDDDAKLSIKAAEPKWKPGRGPQSKEVAGMKRGRSGTHPFFTWFCMGGEYEAGTHDEIADCIKEDIWPNPVKYYLEEGADEDEAGFDEGEEGVEDEDYKDYNGEEGLEGEEYEEGEEEEGLEGGEGEEYDEDQGI